MNRGLVALSSAAILGVYGAGYVLSQPAAVTMAASPDAAVPASSGTAVPTPSQSAASASGAQSSSLSSGSASPAAPAAAGSGSPAAGTTNVSASPATAGATAASQPSAAQPSTSGAAASGAVLKDGTYTGSGTSRHGGVNVSVVIKNGQIASAAITSVTTRYSQNVISGLPAEVVKAQSANVNMVSGATDSSSAYIQAVQQALSKASGSTSTGGTVQLTGPQGVIYSSGNGAQA